VATQKALRLADERAPDEIASGNRDASREDFMIGLNAARSASIFAIACSMASWPVMALARQAAGDKATDPSDRYTVALFRDNVTNRRFQTQVLFNTLGTGTVWNSPVTYGIELGAKFR